MACFLFCMVYFASCSKDQLSDDTEMDEMTGTEECMPLGTTYSGDVVNILRASCYSCHSGSSPIGRLRLDSYETVKIVAENGSLFGTISWKQGFSRMPQGGAQLDNCKLAKIKNWIDSGVVNN